MLSALDAGAQNYRTVVVFGDSYVDTGNTARLIQTKYGQRYPAPAYGYTDGRFTDGTDTTPRSTLYAGNWVEQLAAMLPAAPPVKASLEGGSNYAEAGTGTGGSPSFGPGYTYAPTQLADQVSQLLAASPRLDSSMLFVFAYGSDYVFSVPYVASAGVANIGVEITNQMKRLVDAGATEFLIVNLPPVGSSPQYTGTADQVARNNNVQGVSTYIGLAIPNLVASYSDRILHVAQTDVFSLLTNAIASPAAAGLDNVANRAQNTGGNPDRYLWWDDSHLTTTGHHLIAAQAFQDVKAASSVTAYTSSTTLSALLTSINLGGTVVLTATVKATGGQPVGSVTIYDGTSVLATSALTIRPGTVSADTTIYLPSLAAGAHSLTASYAGTGVYPASVSQPLSVTVVAPSLSLQTASSALTVARGGSGSVVLSVTSAGGISGTATVNCGPVAAALTCAPSPSNFAIPSSSAAAQNITIVVTSTGQTAAVLSESGSAPLALAGILLLPVPIVLRRQLRPVGLLCVAACAATLLCVEGCSSGSPKPIAATYNVPVTVSAGAVSSTLSLQVTLQ